MTIKQLIIREFINEKFIKFVLVGGLAAVVNIVSRVGFSIYTNYLIAIALAYCVGMLTAYLLNRQYVFVAGENSVKQEMGRFAIVNIIALLQIALISTVLAWVIFPLVGITRWAETISHIIAVISPVFTSFIFHKYWTFKEHNR